MKIGVTGSFGTGKTTAAAMFKKLGAKKVIDADKIVHSLIDRNMRKNLSKVVFKRREYLNKLCKIIHPFVIDRIRKICAKYKKKIIVIDAPLLIETGLHKEVDYVIVVKAKKSVQIERVRRKTKLSRKEIQNRIKSQMPLRKKIKLADFVVDNSGLISNTREQVKNILKTIKEDT